MKFLPIPRAILTCKKRVRFTELRIYRASQRTIQNKVKFTPSFFYFCGHRQKNNIENSPWWHKQPFPSAEDISPILYYFLSSLSLSTTSHSLHEFATPSNYLIKILPNFSLQQQEKGFRNDRLGAEAIKWRWRNPGVEPFAERGKEIAGEYWIGTQIKESSAEKGGRGLGGKLRTRKINIEISCLWLSSKALQ